MAEAVKQVTHADLVRQAREHYERVSMEANEWSSLIPKCIDAFEREADLRTQVEMLTLALRVATCTCSPRYPTDAVPLDNVASHHDFSCGFRQAMQPVLAYPGGG